jgi:hypothetical protein
MRTIFSKESPEFSERLTVSMVYVRQYGLQLFSRPYGTVSFRVYLPRTASWAKFSRPFRDSE